MLSYFNQRKNLKDSFLNTRHDSLLTQNLILKWPNLIEIILLAEENEDFQNACLAIELTDHWDAILSSQNLPVLLKTPYSIHYKPQPKIPSFMLLKGAFFFFRGLYLYEENNHERAIPLLKKASEYGLFTASAILIQESQDQIIGATSSKEKLLDGFVDYVFTNAKRLADIHGAPGYLLLANCCLFYAEYLKVMGEGEARINTFYEQAVQYLWTTKILWHSCAEAIYNAFEDEGIRAANCLGSDNIDEVIDYYLQNLSCFANKRIIQIVEEKAKQEAEAYNSNFNHPVFTYTQHR